MLGKCQSLGSAILVVAVLFSFLVFFCCKLLLLLFKFRYTEEKQRKTRYKKKNKKETYSTYRQNSEGHNERTLTHLVTWQRRDMHYLQHNNI